MENEFQTDEIWEEIDGLRRGYEALHQRQETANEVIEDLVRTLFSAPDHAMEWAKKLDAMASKRELFRADDAGIAWLRTLRDDLICWHGFAPFVKQAAERGELRPIPMRERLRVVGADQQTADAQPLSPPQPAADQPPEVP